MNLIPAEVLIEQLNEAAQVEIRLVAFGVCKDFADYKKRTGLIEGLEKAKRIIIELTEDKK